MIPMTVAEIAAATGGVPSGIAPEAAQTLTVTGPVVTDSRLAEPGSLYVARLGEFADGHDYVESALALGAVAALTQRPVGPHPCVVVDDTETAFGKLARAVVERAPDLSVLALTGSSGKTSTKDLLGSVLASLAPTIAPQGSYNSEIGVPLTVTRVEDSTRYLVVEMGARGAGHVAYLTTLAPPQVGIVLNVGTAHVGEFGSVEAIAAAKSELAAAVPGDGVVVLNADDDRVRAMAGVARGRVVLFGEAGDADVRASEVEVDDLDRPSALITVGSESARLTMRLAGRHQLGNALAAIAGATAVGVPLQHAVAHLSSIAAISRYRMEVVELPGGITLINDAYNANPDSMAAAIGTLAKAGATRRTVAVLGDMLELGPASAALHEEVGRLAATSGVDELITVGVAALDIATGAKAAVAQGHGMTNVVSFAGMDEAQAHIFGLLAPKDVILIKSSHGARLRELGDSIVRAKESNP